MYVIYCFSFSELVVYVFDDGEGKMLGGVFYFFSLLVRSFVRSFALVSSPIHISFLIEDDKSVLHQPRAH